MNTFTISANVSSNYQIPEEAKEKSSKVEMLLEHPFLKLNDETLFVERVENAYILLWHDGLLIRKWEWGSDHIQCFFEEKSSIPLSLANKVVLKGGTTLADVLEEELTQKLASQIAAEMDKEIMKMLTKAAEHL